MISKSILTKLKAGDMSVRDEVIEACMPTATKIANSFAAKHPRSADDIHSEAMYALCKAVKRISDGAMHTEEFKAYIEQSIRRNIKQFIQKDHLIYLPNWYYSQNIENAAITTIPIVYTFDIREQDEENLEEIAQLTFDAPAHDTGDNQIVNEFCKTLTNLERRIIDLRAENYTLAEIGQKINKAESSVLFILNSIKDKFLRNTTIAPVL